MDWKVDAPFVFMDPAKIEQSGIAIYTTFCDYVKALDDVIREKMPGLLDTADKLVGEAGDVKDRAEPEFAALDPLKQGKAVMMTGRNIKELQKLPQQVKDE